MAYYEKHPWGLVIAGLALFLMIIFLAIMITAVSAQQIDKERAAGAVPALIAQRNNAMDALAVCQGDMQTLQKKLSDTEELLKAKTKELEEKTK